MPAQSELPTLVGIDRTDQSLVDDEYRAHSWEELKDLVGANNLGMLRRWPSERKKYMEWSSGIREQYGSVTSFIVQVRLQWQVAPSRDSQSGSLFDVADPVPFRNQADWKILLNDWPYGFEPGVVHLIVWLKHRLTTEPTRGDLTPQSRRQVQAFIDRIFGEDVATLEGTRDRIVWFKNWTALQTVPGIDHIHVLVKDIPPEMLQKWLDG